MSIEIKISKRPISYKIAMKILHKRVEELKVNKGKELLWILEHPITYTAGIRSNNREIIDKKIKIIKTNRGGKITLHNPGQKIIYFVLNLNKRKKDIRKLINKIEECIIKVLNEYKVKSYADKKNIGIWIENKNNAEKIAAIGIRVKKWVAYHGFSINIYNDLTKYKKIVPCGIKNKGVTSFKEIGIVDYTNIDKIIIKNFLNIFL
mgnify:CR=1 FL=1